MENKKRELDKTHLILIIIIFLSILLGIGTYMILSIPIELNETKPYIEPDIPHMELSP